MGRDARSMRERSIDALVCVLACSRTRVTDVREFSTRSIARAWYTDDGGGGGGARRRRERSRMNPYPIHHTAERRRHSTHNFCHVTMRLPPVKAFTCP
mmetsp:Transcript_6924/g.25226  ORF Transcript_6924/g.25226 Transcript_6924/m.25226 type:complete len:98 (+) Transcript_6924:2235-2528(+)